MSGEYPRRGSVLQEVRGGGAGDVSVIQETQMVQPCFYISIVVMDPPGEPYIVAKSMWREEAPGN